MHHQSHSRQPKDMGLVNDPLCCVSFPESIKASQLEIEVLSGRMSSTMRAREGEGCVGGYMQIRQDLAIQFFRDC